MVVTDAEDVHDRVGSDTSTYGNQKALAFTVAWIRQTLRQPRTGLRWTSTENLFVDSGTKDMSSQHMEDVLLRGSWSVKYPDRPIV